MKKTSIFFLTISLLTFNCSDNTAQTDKSETVTIKKIDGAATNNLKTKKLCTGWYYVLDTITEFKYQLDKSSETYYLDPTPIVIKDNIKLTEVYETNFKEQAQNYIGLKIQLDEFGTKRWADATQKAIFKKLAFILDDKLIAASQVNGQITMGVTAINRTEYNRKEINEFKKNLDK